VSPLILNRRTCFQARNANEPLRTVQPPFDHSLFLCVASSPPGSLFPEKTKGQTNRERTNGCAVTDDTETFSRYRKLFLPRSFSLCLSGCLVSGGSIPPWSTLQQMSWRKMPTALPPCPFSPSLPGTAALAPRQAWDRVMMREGRDRLCWKERGVGAAEVKWPLFGSWPRRLRGDWWIEMKSRCVVKRV